MRKERGEDTHLVSEMRELDERESRKPQIMGNNQSKNTSFKNPPLQRGQLAFIKTLQILISLGFQICS